MAEHVGRDGGNDRRRAVKREGLHLVGTLAGSKIELPPLNAASEPDGLVPNGD